MRVRFANLDHRSPEWVDAPIYFLTICAKERGVNQLCGKSALAILESIQFYHEKDRWYCDLAVLMPDHVHLLVSFHEMEFYAKIIGDWKQWGAHHCGITWQENFFEHRLRKEESLDQKGQYLINNPVRAGLVADSTEWPIFGSHRPGESSVARRSTATTEPTSLSVVAFDIFLLG
jgi:putative transposase